MITNYIVRGTVVSPVRINPVVGYCRFEGYPFIKFVHGLRDASFFGDGGTFDKADEANAIKHMRLLPVQDTVKNYFNAWLREVGDVGYTVSYKLELVKLSGPSLEQLEVTVVDTLEGTKEIA